MTFSLIEQDYYEYNLYKFRRNLYEQNLKRVRLYWTFIWITLVIIMFALYRSYYLLLFLVLAFPLQLIIRTIFDKSLIKNMHKNVSAMAQSNSLYFEPRTWVLADDSLKITLTGLSLTISDKHILDVVELDSIIVLACRDAERIIPKRVFQTENQKQSFIQKIKEKIE